jgi:transcriptional regulator with XRE-family HTH domain
MAKPSPKHSGAPLLIALGKAIKKQRLEKGMSQESLALKIGLDRSYMGGIERGEHNIAIINIHKIAENLELKVWELLKLSGF